MAGSPAFADDFWLSHASMPMARRGHAAAELGGKVYVFGGCGNGFYCSSDLSWITASVYDPGSDTWSTITNMPAPFWFGAAASPGNGKLYTLGGLLCADDLSSCSIVNTLREYDPGTNNWTTKAPMPTARWGLAAASVNGRIYAIGGNGSSAVEEYDPATNTWVVKAHMPTARTLLAVAVFNGRIYAIGGSPDNDGNTQTNVVEQYDPIRNIWAPRAPMPAALQVSAGAALNGKVYTFGGFFVCCEAHDNTYEYDPLRNLWANRTSMPTARDEAPAVTANGRVYVIGGADAGRNALYQNEEYTPPPAAPACVPIAVPIDIKPDETPNTIKLSSGGSISVAVFSTSGFNAVSLDPTTSAI